jgi:hypothetical protein
MLKALIGNIRQRLKRTPQVACYLCLHCKVGEDIVLDEDARGCFHPAHKKGPLLGIGGPEVAIIGKRCDEVNHNGHCWRFEPKPPRSTKKMKRAFASQG